jgi:Dolichyl-phosphate-mannose-protein mannosyltransferase
VAETVPLAPARGSSAPAAPQRMWPARLATLLSLGLGLLAGLLLGASLLPEPVLADRLGELRGTAQAGVYTQQLLQHAAERLRLAGLAFALLAALLVAGRGAAARLLEDGAAAGPQLRADCLAGLAAVRRAGPLHLAALGVALVVATGLRLAYLGQPVRYDEAFSYTEFASRPLYYALSFYPEPNNQLFHTLLVHLSTGLFGNELWALRLPAFVAGVLLVPATYAVGRLLYGRRAALLAACLVAVSSVLVEYSTNARGYTLLCLFFLVGLALAAYLVRTGSAAALLLLAISLALGFYTIPTMLYGFATLLVWLAWSGPGRGRPGWAMLAALVVATALLALVLYLPPILVSGLNNLLGNRFVAPLAWGDFMAELPRSLRATWDLWLRDVPAPVGALLVLGFLVSLASWGRGGRSPPPVVLAAAIACLPILALQRVVPFERVWLFLLPVFLLAAADGLARLIELVGRGQGRVDALVAGLAVAASLGLGGLVLAQGSVLRSPETGNFPDAEAVSVVLAGRLQPMDSVLTTVPASLPELQYYVRRLGADTGPLARDPAAASRLYLVVPPSDTPPPTPGGWSTPTRLARFPTADVYELQR